MDLAGTKIAQIMAFSLTELYGTKYQKYVHNFQFANRNNENILLIKFHDIDKSILKEMELCGIIRVISDQMIHVATKEQFIFTEAIFDMRYWNDLELIFQGRYSLISEEAKKKFLDCIGDDLAINIVYPDFVSRKTVADYLQVPVDEILEIIGSPEIQILEV